MLKYEFNFDEDNMEETNEFILEKTTEKIRQLQKELNKEVFNTVCADIETWLYERFDNVRYNYFDNIVSFLLGVSKPEWNDNLKLNEWLTRVGYNQTSFRKKIYQDNKEIINEALANDAIYERMEAMFESGYFRSWDFSDISKGYPQSDLVRNFLHNLLEKDGFDKIFEDMLDFKINQKKNELDILKKRLTEIKQEISELE